MKKVVNVNLYGDGSRKAPMRAEYIYCEHSDVCSAHKQGKCMGVSSFFSPRCPLASISFVRGGIKTSKKCLDVQAEARKHECYNTLKYPGKTMLIRAGDKAVLKLNYVWISNDDGHIKVESPHLTGIAAVVDKHDLTVEALHRICSFRPHAIIGYDELREYQATVVPNFLKELSELFPDEYAALIMGHPEYAERMPNYVGRRATLKTVNRAGKYIDSGKNIFKFDGDYIVCEKYASAFTPFLGLKSVPVELRIKVTDDMTCIVTSNDQVTEETVFTD